MPTKKSAKKAVAKTAKKGTAKPVAKKSAKPVAKKSTKPAAKKVAKATAKVAQKTSTKANKPALKKAKPATGKKPPAATKTVKKVARKKPSKQRAPAVTATEADTKKAQPANVSSVPRPFQKKASPLSFSLEDVQTALAERQLSEPREPRASLKKQKADAPAEAKPKAKPVIADAPVEKKTHGAASIADILGFNPAQKKPETELNAEEIPKKWVKYYRLLLELRQHVKEELDLHTADTLKRSSREDSGDLSGYGQHQADAATDSFDRDFALSLLSSEQDALYEIEEAIKRIKNGTYGNCEVTGEAIPKDRLAAVPFTRFSIEGQREFEKNRRRKVDRSGAFADTSDAVSLAGDDDDDD